jgi:hypothetical protein
MTIDARFPLLALTLSIAVATALPGLAAEKAHEHDVASHKLTLNAGKKWNSDEPLRRGMTEIRDLMAAQHDAIHKNRSKPDEYATLGTKIESAVATVIAECKLEPAADGNLHIVLAEILDGAEAMQGKKRKTGARAGANKVVAGLATYAKYFDHPGWKGI